jgi:DNA-binding SARP family transcriptional activator
VGVLGPAKLGIDGVTVHLTPLTTRLLVRLVAAEGEAVSVGRLRRDVWDIDEQPHQAQRSRNEVQKRVLELRQAFDLAGPGQGARILRTEQILTARAPETSYRLVLEPDQLDCAEFADLVNSALHAVPTAAVRMLTDAVALVRGRPLAEADGEEFARALTRRLTAAHDTARRELIRNLAELGRYDLALPVAERMAREMPADPEASETLGMLRGRLRERHGDEILRHELPGLRVRVVVVRGDLFDQSDANLVVGFTDTFDVATGQDYVISRESVQGQLVERIFGGRSRELDAELRRGLRGVAPVSVESVQDKPKGKRVRYPIGTVVAVPIGGRRVFATAYSRLGNDLVARSTPEDLRRSLDRLWECAARHGMFKPVAVPLVGSGLARITELGRDQLMIMIVDSFAEGCRRHPAVAPELRIVIRPADLEKTDLSTVEKFIGELEGNGSRR